MLALPPYHCCEPAFDTIRPGGLTRSSADFFGAPACRVFPDHLVTCLLGRPRLPRAAHPQRAAARAAAPRAAAPGEEGGAAAARCTAVQSVTSNNFDVLHANQAPPPLLKPTSTFKGPFMTCSSTNNGLLACRRVTQCNTCVLKPPSSAAVGAVGTGWCGARLGGADPLQL